MSKEQYGKEWLIRSVASRARFTVSDTKIIIDEFINVVQEIIKEDNMLTIPGLFSLYTKTIKAHKGHDAVRNIPLDIKESHRIVFTASRSLLDELKDDKQDEIKS